MSGLSGYLPSDLNTVSISVLSVTVTIYGIPENIFSLYMLPYSLTLSKNRRWAFSFSLRYSKLDPKTGRPLGPGISFTAFTLSLFNEEEKSKREVSSPGKLLEELEPLKKAEPIGLQIARRGIIQWRPRLAHAKDWLLFVCTIKFHCRIPASHHSGLIYHHVTISRSETCLDAAC